MLARESLFLSNALPLSLDCLSRSAELCILRSAGRVCDRLGVIAVIRADKAMENLFLSGFSFVFLFFQVTCK